MNDLEIKVVAYQKKQNLVRKYYDKMATLEEDRKALNKKINKCKDALYELIEKEVNDELTLFDDIDAYLADEPIV